MTSGYLKLRVLSRIIKSTININQQNIYLYVDTTGKSFKLDSRFRVPKTVFSKFEKLIYGADAIKQRTEEHSKGHR